MNPRRTPVSLGAAVLSGALLAGCSGSGGWPSAAEPGSTADPTATSGTSGSADPTTGSTSEPTTDPDTPTSWGPTEGELAEAAELVAAMSVEEQVAAVLMPGFWGYDGQRPAPAEVVANRRMHGAGTAVRVLEKHGFGGVFLRPEVISDAFQVATLTQALHEVGDEPGGLPLLVSIDQEGGGVQRLQEGVDPVPSAASVGATGDPSYATEVALANGTTLRELGVTMVMAPVAGVDPGGVSALGTRTYSSDPEVVAEMVTASVEGYLEAGVLPVVKHFPGLGSVTGDSHFSLPEQTKTLDELLATDLVPFEAAIEAGAPVVMTGHVAVEAIDPGVPASVSPDVVEGVLRGTLGFDGVVVTDSQGMGPIHAVYGPGEGAVLSLVAGSDLVLNSPSPKKARRAVERAVEEGRLSEQQLAGAAARVLALRMYLQRLPG